MVEYQKRNFSISDLLIFGKFLVLGDDKSIFSSVSNLEDIKDNSLIYITEIKFLEKAVQSSASVVIAPYSLEKDLRQIIEKGTTKTFILCENPKLLFAYATSLFKKRKINHGIDNTVKSKTNLNDKKVEIEPYVTIGANVSIGNDVFIGSFVSIGDNCKIGDGTIIFSGVKIYENVEIGNECIIHANAVIGADGFGYVFNSANYQKIEHLGKIIIEDRVEIGANSCIDRATIGETRIKKGTKIDNLVQIAHNVEIGENNVICSQVGIAGGAKLGNFVTCAGQVGISDHAILEDNIIVGAQTGLTPKRYSKNSFLLGTPAMDATSFKKSFVYFSKLPELVNKIYYLNSSLEKINKILGNKDQKENKNE